jgi:hypothetical protein
MGRKTGRRSAAELIAGIRKAIAQPNADKERSVRPP